MNATNTNLDELREELKDPEMSEGYAESFLDSYIATQIKVLREQHQLSQQGLAERIGTRQGVISRIENVNYSKWNVTTLKKLARAFRVRLKISFETYGSLPAEVDAFSRDGLQRTPREADPLLYHVQTVAKPAARAVHSKGYARRYRASAFHQGRNTTGDLQQTIYGLTPGRHACDFSFASPQKPRVNSAQELAMEATG